MDEILKLLQEAVDRSRRIETRLTKYLTAIGFETGVRKPVWTNGAVEVPSLATSFVDILAAIPEGLGLDVEIIVTFQGSDLGYVLKP